ncbi:MAG: hypothetical protein FWF58_00095, partial [Firmicutes bacterium]|nr:hypothetical protein [Bacillota bacterium]
REGSGERYYYVEVTNAVQVHYGRDNGVRVHYNKVVSKVFVVRLASNWQSMTIPLMVMLLTIVAFIFVVTIILIMILLMKRRTKFNRYMWRK